MPTNTAAGPSTNKFIDPETDKILVWKYHIEEFTIIYKQSTYSVEPEKITGLSFKGKMETDLFPIIKINMSIEPSIYKEMVANKNDLKIKIRMQKYSENTDSQEKSLYKDCIVQTFSLLLDDEFTDPDDAINTEKKLSDNNGNNEETNELTEVQQGNKNEFFLYNESVVLGMKTTVNTVLRNITMIGAISYFGTLMKVDSFLISPIENGKTYEEILIPPQSTLSAIQYVDTQYGFYKMGSILWFDYDYQYILNYRGGCTAWVKDEIKETCVLIPEKGGQYGSIEGTLVKPDEKEIKNYVIVSANSVDARSDSISDDVLRGNKSVLVNTNTNNITTSTGETIQRGEGSYDIVNTNTSNEWLANTLAAQKQANSSVITCSAGGFDIDAIKPNKKYTIIFENTKQGQKYKGIYLLADYTFTLEKSGSDFLLDGQFTLKKTGGVIGEITESTESINNEDVLRQLSKDVDDDYDEDDEDIDDEDEDEDDPDDGDDEDDGDDDDGDDDGDDDEDDYDDDEDPDDNGDDDLEYINDNGIDYIYDDEYDYDDDEGD